MSGKLHAQIAREVGITGESLRRWLKQTDLDEGKRPDGLMSDEQEEERRQRWRRRREQVDDPNTGRRLTLFSPPHRINFSQAPPASAHKSLWSMR